MEITIRVSKEELTKESCRDCVLEQFGDCLVFCPGVMSIFKSEEIIGMKPDQPCDKTIKLELK